MILYTIKSTKSEVKELKTIISKISLTIQTYREAYILLNTNQGDCSRKVTNKRSCEVLRIGMCTIDKIKKLSVEEGLEATLERCFVNRSYESKIDGDINVP